MTQPHTYQKGDRVVTSGEGRTARWSRMTGSVAQVLSARSVEVYFDGVAFGHEMFLEEIALLPDFYYARLVHPQQLFLGSMGDKAIYADCADCGAEEAVIHGCIKDRQGQTAVIPLNGGVVFPQRGPAGKLAVFCESCFGQRLDGGPDLSPADGALAFPQHPLLL
jgi:hypothetical protein